MIRMPQTSHQNVEHSCLIEVEEFDSGHFLEMASSYLAVKALVRCRTERFVKQNVSLFSRRQEQVKIYSSAREHPALQLLYAGLDTMGCGSGVLMTRRPPRGEWK